MKITDALLGEHGVFRAQLDYLAGTLPSVEDLTSITSQAALLSSALTIHAQLEEELLFKSLDPHLGEMGPLAMMRMEHQEIEHTLKQILGTKELMESRQRLMHITDVARQHFDKEEQMLFKLAEQTLGEDVLRNLGARWAERRGVMI
jgi:hemerythrin-like domain-containing protein